MGETQEPPEEVLAIHAAAKAFVTMCEEAGGACVFAYVVPGEGKWTGAAAQPFPSIEALGLIGLLHVKAVTHFTAEPESKDTKEK